MLQPKRYVISATLLTCSPLAIHTGFGSEDLKAMGTVPKDSKFREPSPWNFDELDSCDQLIARDWKNHPYIPGSSLKGVIRRYFSRPCFTETERTAILWLLGREPNSDGDEGMGDGGACVFENGFLDTMGQCVWNAQPFFKKLHDTWAKGLFANSFKKMSLDFAASLSSSDAFLDQSWRARHERLKYLTHTNHLPYYRPEEVSYVETLIAVDRRTGTAGAHKLFTCECVPSGIPFRVQFVIDHGEHALLGVQLILQALAGFNLDPAYDPVQLGSGSNHGWGRLACLFPSVQVQEWLPVGYLPFKNSELIPESVMKKVLANPPCTLRPRVQIDLALHFDGPFLVKDPSSVCALEASNLGIVKSGDGESNKPPDSVPRVASTRLEKTSPDNSADNKKAGLWVVPLLPATSFKGPMRSQIERILTTIFPMIAVGPHGEPAEVDSENPNCPEFVQSMLGFESHESSLSCSEFVAKRETEISRMKREMVAIDRFTGGASKHAKFDVLYVDRPVLHGAITINLPSDTSDAKSVLGSFTLLLRDLIEGDVPFGMGDMKGFGQCRADIESIAIAWHPDLQWLETEIESLFGPVDFQQWLKDTMHCVLKGADTEKLAKLDAILDSFLDELRNQRVGASLLRNTIDD